MKASKTILSLTIVSVAALAAQISSAQPSGSITNHITGAANVLWDCSQLSPLQNIEIYVEKISHGGDTNEVDVQYAATVAQDGRGKLASQPGLTTTVSLIPEQGAATETFTGTYLSKGSISSSKGVAKLTFSSKVSGQATVQGALRAVSAMVTYTVTIDANAGQLSGRAVDHASAVGAGSLSSHSTFGPQAINSELGDGTWTLVLTFGTPAGNKLEGTATVTLATGAVYPFNFTGTFTPHTGQSKLNLKGFDNDAGTGLGSTLQVTLDQNNATSRIVGRVSGQSVNFTP